MSADRTCTATFTLLTYALTLTATPTPGARFLGWSGEGCTGTGSCTVTMTQARTVTAPFLWNPDAVGVFRSADGTFYLDYVVRGPGTHPLGWVRCRRAPATSDPFRTADHTGFYLARIIRELRSRIMRARVDNRP